jgi:diguanylate cyclase (GGDEF)-like protein
MLLSSDVMSGAPFHGFLRACLNLNVISGQSVARLISGIDIDGWYPIDDFIQIQEMVWADYREPEAIMERAGEEYIRLWYSEGRAADAFTTGIGFIRFQAGSRGYSLQVRGNPARIGRFELAEVNEAAGTATIVSTTPFRCEFEKGILLGGLLAPGDLSHVEIEIEIERQGASKIFRVKYKSGTPLFQERLNAARLHAELEGACSLPGIAPAEMLWRYHSLAAQYARDKAFWRATNVTLEESNLRALRMSAGFEKLATTDALTGFASRRCFMERGELELLRARRFNHPLSVLFLDVDHFKLINDAYGHLTGDRVLKALAEACQGALRDIDLVGRLGGDEFAVLLAETDLAGATEVADRLRRTVEMSVIEAHGSTVIEVTTSIGVAVNDPADNSFEPLLARADAALYSAKRTGRNRVGQQK